MTKVLLVFGHDDSKNSFNAAMKDVAIETLTGIGIEVKVSLLQDMNMQCFSRKDFKGELERPEQLNWGYEMSVANMKGTMSDEIKEEQEKVKWADVILYQFPIHGLSFPAIVSAWNTKILTANFAQTDSNCFENGLMKGKRILLSATFGGTESMFCDRGMFGDVNIILYPIMKSFHFFGFSMLKPQVSFGVMPGSDETCTEHLKRWRERLSKLKTEEVVENYVLPDKCFGSNFVLTEECEKKYASDEFGPTVGVHMGKKIPKML